MSVRAVPTRYDAVGRCVHCDLGIGRIPWGDGGWLWIHNRTGLDECPPVTRAEPADDTVTERRTGDASQELGGEG